MMDSYRELQKFRQFAEREKNKRKGAFFFTFPADEGEIFVQEERFLQELFPNPEEMMYPFVPMESLVRFPDQLEDDQILCYYSLIPFFQTLSVDSYIEDSLELELERYVYYGSLYMLEAANMIYHKEEVSALKAICHLYDILSLHVDAKEQKDYKDYMVSLLEGFLIIHPACKEAIIAYFRKKNVARYHPLWEEIYHGYYEYAAAYVKENARQLKEKEKVSDKPYIVYSWYALEKVFYALTEKLPQCGSLMTAGKRHNIILDLPPIQGMQDIKCQELQLTEQTCLRRIRTYGGTDKWGMEIWSPYEGTGDFLAMIYIYTESMMREKIGGPKRGRSCARILKKKYKRSDDLPANIYQMKKILQSKSFEEAIQKGIEDYLTDHPTIAGNKTTKQLLYDMDHETPEKHLLLNRDKLKQAKADMRQVLHLLHEEEVEYSKTSQKKADNDRKKEEFSHKETGALTSVEKEYLCFLLEGRQKEGRTWLESHHLSERILVKEINEKVLPIIGDVALEYEGREIILVEDYIDEIKALITEKE